jgi:hypothetical protein
MQEDFLHFIWKYKRFDFRHLITTHGEPIEILSTGDHNHNSGPDFFQAKIKIGDTLWVGNVEIHLKSSDWNRHRHQFDESYDNVILHVVYDHDEEITDSKGRQIPTLVLKELIPSHLIQDYENIIKSKNTIPCQNLIHQVDDFVFSHWIDRLVIERLERKSETIEALLNQCNQDWQEAFYRQIAYGFGLKVNAEGFLKLSENLPLLVLGKHKDHLFQVEALLFGQAGMLNDDLEEDYPNKLKQEYDFLRKKFSLSPMSQTHWKFMRLRPSSFPTIRIAQFAQLIHQSSNLFSKILASESPEQIRSFFQVEASEYWQTHYRFGKVSQAKKKTIGEKTLDLILINTVVPFLFVYGRKKKQQQYIDMALGLLESIPAEKNNIIDPDFRTGTPKLKIE